MRSKCCGGALKIGSGGVRVGLAVTHLQAFPIIACVAIFEKIQGRNTLSL